MSFTVHLTGASFQKKTDGSIEFIDTATNQPVAWIPAPFMTDANGQTSTAVSQSIVKNSDGSYTLTITADPAWLNASGRSFPVTIDPTITTTPVSVQPNATTGRDTFISSSNPSSNYASSTVLYAGSTSSYGTTDTLIDFQNLPNIVPGGTGATIQSATLQVYQTNSGEGGMALSAEPITSSWTSGSVTWNNRPSFGSPLDTQTYSTNGPGTYTGNWQFNITSLVKQWYSEQGANYGVAIVGGTSSYASFVSSDDTSSADAGDQPKLTITYSVQPVGEEPFWTETSDGVNLMDGNLSLTVTDLDTPGRGYDLSVTRTYNSLMQNSPAPGHTNLFGNGWSSNLDMSIADWGRGPIIFTDANGLQHIFVTTNNYGGQWATSDAEHLQLTTGNGYTVTEQDGTKINFNPSRKLTSISVPTKDNGANVTTFNYNTSGQLSSITDPSGRVMTVTLNSSGYIQSITDPAGRVASYNYDSNGNLISVTIAAQSGSADTATIQYGYDPTTGMLSSYTDANGVQTTYGYTNGEVSSVTRPITFNGSVVNARNSYSYSTDSSGNPTTTVTDANSRSVLYTLNANGNVTKKQVDPSGLNLTTQYTWDQYEQCTAVTNPNGNTTNYLYDNNSNLGPGKPWQIQDANGNSQYESYNGNGKLTGQDDSNASISRDYFNNTQITDSVDGLGMDSMTDYNQYGMPTQVSAPVALGQNLIPNSSFEFVNNNGLPTDWQIVSGVGTVTDTTTTSEFGSHAVQIQAGSTGATWIEMGTAPGTYLYIPVEPGKSYALSTWVETSGVQGTSSGGQQIGACINTHWYQNNTGTVSAVNPGTNYLDNMVGTNGWTRLTTTVTAPSDAYYFLINLVLYGSTGTATWDGVQLEPLSDAGSKNAVLNSSFKDNPPGATLPDVWGTVMDSGVSAKIDSSATGEHDGMYSMLLSGVTGKTNQLYEYINIPQYAWNGIVVSFWSKQSGATADSTNGPQYNVKLYCRYPDGTGQNVTPSQLYPSVSTTAWQHLTADIPKSQLNEPNTGTPPKAIEVYIDFNGQTGQAWFNDVEAKFESAASSAGDYNRLDNPGFENSINQSGWPDFWNTAVGGGSAAYVSDDGSTSTSGEVHTGTHALELVPESSGTPGATAETVTDMANYAFYNHNFTVVGYIHTVNMAHDGAYIELNALDANGNVLKSFVSQKIGHTTADSAGNVGWTRVDAVMLASQAPAGTASVSVTLAVDPDANGSSAAAYFDDILLDQSDLFASIAYDANNNYATQVADQLGNTVSLGYGSDNTGGGFSANFTGVNTGDPSQVTDPNGNNSYFSYNKFDQITGYTYTAQVSGTTVNPTFNYTYDGNGSLKSIQDPTGHNQFNLPTSQTETAGGYVDTTTESYNAGGLLTGVSHPNGSSSSLTYDAANRLIGVTDTLGSTTDTFGFGYYNDGTVKSVSQGSSQVYSYTYDKLGQLQTVTQPYSGTVNNTETFTPDPDGNLKTIAYAVGSTTWNVNNTFNDGNQLMSATDGTGTVNFAYAPAGLLENISDASGVTTYYTYYPNLQVSEVRAVDKNGNVLEDYTYTYDANGNLKQITDTTSNTSLSFTYDSLNQLTQETTWTGDTISYAYDKLGNRTSV
ncbi:MAG: DNRLRE domain-containing protein, partial [Alicyclobacillus macrosporangiidus]|uniref:DNRLRE domain-containing protein n=1 Tax=Alicyclobacillus macrosporangiidus TaxID=392015 RepID=UPI0026EA3464